VPVHPPNNVLYAPGQIEFLGFILDSVTMTISIKNNIRKLLRMNNISIREVCKTIGKIIATMPVNRWAKRGTNRTIKLRDEALSKAAGNYEEEITLTEEVREDFRQQLKLLDRAVCTIFESVPDLVLFSHASTKGWGVYAPFRRDELRKFGGDGTLNKPNGI